MRERPLLFVGADERQGSIGAHTARVGAEVAVVGTFVILTERHGIDATMIHEGHERELRALEEVFDHHFAFAERLSHKHVAESVVRLGLVLRYNYAFAGSQTVVFENRGISPAGTDVGDGFVVVGETAVRGCRHIVTCHELFGKLLAGLNLCGGFGVSEDGNACRAEGIHHACGETGFGSYDAEVDLLLLCEGEKGRNVGVGDGHALGK